MTDAVTDIEAKFAEIEKRVKALLSENAGLAKRLRELEADLAQARQEARDLQNFRSKKIHVQEKVERILKALEAAGTTGP